MRSGWRSMQPVYRAYRHLIDNWSKDRLSPWRVTNDGVILTVRKQLTQFGAGPSERNRISESHMSQVMRGDAALDKFISEAAFEAHSKVRFHRRTAMALLCERHLDGLNA